MKYQRNSPQVALSPITPTSAAYEKYAAAAAFLLLPSIAPGQCLAVKLDEDMVEGSITSSTCFIAIWQRSPAHRGSEGAKRMPMPACCFMPCFTKDVNGISHGHTGIFWSAIQAAGPQQVAGLSSVPADHKTYSATMLMLIYSFFRAFNFEFHCVCFSKQRCEIKAAATLVQRGI